MQKKIRILFIEDERYFRDLILEELKSYGSVATASDLNSALAILDSETFDLIISDIDLENGKEGLEVLKKAKEKCSDSLIVALTGHKEDEMILACHDSDCNHFFYKPQFLKDRARILKGLVASISKINYDDFFTKEYISINEKLKNQIVKLFKSNLPNNMNIMILGPTGVGKSILAKKIHEYAGGTVEFPKKLDNLIRAVITLNKEYDHEEEEKLH